MKIRIISDIHLDHYSDCMHKTRLFDPNEPKVRPHFWYPPVLPTDKETTLILAGDVWIGTRFIEYAGFSWIAEVAKEFKQVLIILGNHDFWSMGDLTIKNGADKCNAMLQDYGILNVKVLDCDTHTDGDVLFVGATLWTDMNNFDPIAMYNMPKFMHYDGKIAFLTGHNGAWERFTSQKWISEHLRHRDYIRIVAEQNRDKKIVVITHHLPLQLLCDPKYVGDTSNAYYASNLSELILDNENIVLWGCGHSHCSNDVMFEQCRMYMNPIGYAGEHREQEGQIKHEVIEI